MEINKLTFENLRNINIAQTFEDLDVNNDGVKDGYKDEFEALKGDIDVQSIKNSTINKAEAPTNIFEDIIEIEEEE